MKLGRCLLILIIVLLLSYTFNTIGPRSDVIVPQGGSYTTFFKSLSWRDSLTLKIYLKLNYQKPPTIYPGVYRFNTPLSYGDFLKTIAIAPKPVTIQVTLLEGWSSFDYDALLTKKGYILGGEYRNYITNQTIIKSLKDKYLFLPEGITSLEGFLYPDTYNIDVNKGNTIEQLVKLQLDNFYNKVRGPDPQLFTGFTTSLYNDGFTFRMSPYSIIKLASIIENEEKNNQNKQTIAGLFLNRIQENMQLGADVTLCYGKSITYNLCTPSFIIANLYDKSNPYNTRQIVGLPPTPISNPSIESIAGVLTYKKSDYLYYLHDTKGSIYYASTLLQHNQNKNNYLRN